jgi:hypothetical protein
VTGALSVEPPAGGWAAGAGAGALAAGRFTTRAGAPVLVRGRGRGRGRAAGCGGIAAKAPWARPTTAAAGFTAAACGRLAGEAADTGDGGSCIGAPSPPGADARHPGNPSAGPSRSSARAAVESAPPMAAAHLASCRIGRTSTL